MSLRAILTTPQESPSETTLAFAFNYQYLEPFKALLRSLIRCNTLLDCPIAIYSDDRRVFDDPMVQLVVDKVRLIDGEEKTTLYDMARDTVKRPERGDWNRGTFLKWAVFEPQQTEQLLFLDVDMIVLAPLEGLLEMNRDAHILCAPQFQKGIHQDGDRVRSKAEIAQNITQLMSGDLWGAHKSRINSGMMLLRGPLITRKFRKEVFEYTSSKVTINEQSHLSRFFKERNYKRKMLPIKYNFQESYLHWLEPDAATEILKQISVLHYAGGNKPWEKNGGLRDSEKLWFQA